MFCAHVPEMTFPDLQSGAVAEPDWGVGMQVSGRGFLTVEVLSPGFAIFCFLVLSSTMPKLSSLCNLPNPRRPTLTTPWLHRYKETRPAPGLFKEHPRSRYGQP